MNHARVMCLAVLVIAALAVPASALIGSIGNARMIITTSVNPSEPTVFERTILVKNVNDFPVNVSLKPIENISTIIAMSSPSIILQPNESMDVPFTITVTEPGTYDGRIVVSFLSLNSSIQQPGVVLASRIILVVTGQGAGVEETPDDASAELTAPDLEADATPEPAEEEYPGIKETTESETPAPEGNAAEVAGTQGQANPVIGIGLMALIVIVGLVVYRLASGKA